MEGLRPPGPATEPLDAAPVHSEVVDPEARRGADLDHSRLAAEQEFEVVHEADPGPAARMQVAVGGGEDARPPGVRHEAFHAGEGGVRVPREFNWCDPVAA